MLLTVVPGKVFVFFRTRFVGYSVVFFLFLCVFLCYNFIGSRYARVVTLYPGVTVSGFVFRVDIFVGRRGDALAFWVTRRA